MLTVALLYVFIRFLAVPQKKPTILKNDDKIKDQRIPEMDVG
jgi:hypothetical protein